MYLGIVLILFLVLIFYLLLVPIVLFIDTDKKQYYLQLKGLAKASVEADRKEVLRINLKTLFMNFYFYPIRSFRTEKEKEKKEMKRKWSRSNLGLRRLLKIVKSFKVKKIRLTVDTGDCIANAKLYPVFANLDYKIGGFHVNFEGRNQLKLHIENRPIYIIKSFFNF